MSTKKNKRTDLSSLVSKYQRYSVVSEIEHNLLGATGFQTPIDDLNLSDLFLEENYDLSLYSSLEDSIRKEGFFVPLIIVKNGDKLEIINGVKRYLLAKKIGLKTLTTVKADLSTERKFAYILENIQAEGDSALVKAYAFGVLKDKYGYDEKKLAELSSTSIAQVRNLLRLKQLPLFLKEAMISFKISYGEARSLLNLPLEKQKELYEKIINGSLSVRELEKEKRTYAGTQKKTKVTKSKNKITITFTNEKEAEKYYPRLFKEFSD